MMKKFFIYLLIFFCLLFAIYFFPQTYDNYLEPKNIFSEHFSKIPLYPEEEDKPFVLIVYASNAVDYCEKNLRSVLEQEYENFRVIYIDDGSIDGTIDCVQKFAQKNQGKRITFIRNEKKRGMAPSLFDAIHSCQNGEIILLIEGRDWLSQSGALKILNRVYANPNVWMTYGQYVSYPSYQRGVSAPISSSCWERDGVRGHAWVFSHLKTFYAGLFKHIRLKELLYEGQWIDRCVEMAIMFPLLEMAQEEHVAFISDVLYICTEENGVPRERLDLLAHNQRESFLRNLLPNSKLSCVPYLPSIPSYAVDIAIFSLDRCMQLYACLESIEQNVIGVNKIFVIYFSTNERFRKSYEILKKRFPQVIFISEPSFEKFKPIILANIFGSSKAPYVMFGVDSSFVKEKIDLVSCIQMMEKTHAYGFFFRLGNFDLHWNVPLSIPLENHIHAWQLSQGEKEWGSSHDLDLTLYRKEDIYKDFVEMSYKDVPQLRRNWAMREDKDFHRIGLCFDRTKTVHFSGYRNKVFLTPEEFEELFEKGFKIDTKSISQTKNRTSHIDCEIEFTKR